MDHNGTGTDPCAMANSDGPEQYRSCTNNNIAFDGGVAFGFGQRCAPEHHALIHQDVVTYLRSLTDDYAHAVVDEHAAAKLGPWMNFYAGDKAVEVREYASEKA